MFTFDGWVTRVTFELHWTLETRLHASALDSKLTNNNLTKQIFHRDLREKFLGIAIVTTNAAVFITCDVSSLFYILSYLINSEYLRNLKNFLNRIFVIVLLIFLPF